MYSVQQRSIKRGMVYRNLALLAPRYLICGVVAFFVLIPIVTVVIGGFKTNGELNNAPFALPSIWHWENFASILSQTSFWQALANSGITMLATVGLLLLVSCPTSFALSRIPFRGREVVFNIILFGLLFPASMAILPLYITLRNFGLLNTLIGVILPQTAFALPTTILILRNFFRAIPQELEDATYIDGGSTIDFFWRILLPLARPSLAVVSMLVMVASWNNFLLPLLVLNDANLWTMTMGVMQFQGEHSTNLALTLAYITLAMIPAIVFYLFAERHLIAGLTAGAVKG
ncbi:carbohydrate ABC transporter permease [Ktedonospora formicarum]|uniref:ABC transporter permease n=1 Tax=Ktedonospora formicarum TaxID=2778364 RepID=A0A8J3I7Q7_9CHLR|nr:carbohydrate ABC transporter permease [Ktedonospora formicarum]GHO48390.1 ABC transporter permease [Ktedonospora formicarum]